MTKRPSGPVTAEQMGIKGGQGHPDEEVKTSAGMILGIIVVGAAAGLIALVYFIAART